MFKPNKLLLFFSLLALPCLVFAEESITITTYYPSPYGSYNELTTASNTYLATSSGRVGIGTTGPSYKFQVQSDHYNTKTLLFSDHYGQGLQGANTALLSMWASEPCVTWPGVGIANNISTTGGCSPWIDRINTSRGGSYIRLLDNAIDMNVVDSVNTVRSGIYINGSGNVGIGTTGPTFSIGRGLHIAGVAGTPDAVIRLTEQTSGLNNFELRSTARGTSGNRLEIGEGSDTFLTIRSDDDGGGTSLRGNVGIGTAGPTQKLDVQGHINAGGPGGHDGGVMVNNSCHWIGKGEWSFPGSPTGFGIKVQSCNSPVALYGGGVLGVYASTSGNVGIGTASPGGKLDVNGTIYQRGSVLHADYVFEPDYKLESIEEHSQFMWQNKHLQAVPKAQKDEAGQDMVEIGALNRGVLEELEKAHVYIQQLNERVKVLEARLAKQG